MRACALLALALLWGCDKPAPPPPPPTQAPTEAAPAAPVDAAAPLGDPCRSDRDCLRGWHPTHPMCGPVDRCVEGHCRLPAAITGRPDALSGRLVFETPSGERNVQVEIARGPVETTRGMMCREGVAPGWGMLFFMRQTRVQSFWMRNTLIPLDMVFIDEAWRIVGVYERAAPLTLKGRSVGKPSRYVLELKGGDAARLGLKAGLQARFYPPRR